MYIHTVRAGETLYSIAQEYSASVADLILFNGLTRVNRLAVGQSLAVLLPSLRHLVQRGDTLSSIAEKYGTSVRSVLRANPQLNGSSTIIPGSSLIIEFEGCCRWSFPVGGYAYPFIDLQLLNRTLPYLTSITPFTYGFTPEGALIKPDDAAIRDAAAKLGVDCFMHLSSLNSQGLFDTSLSRGLLDDPSAQTVLISACIEQMQTVGFVGLDVDFEYLGAGYAEKYAHFLGMAREACNSAGFTLIAALAPKTSDGQRGELYEGHDYALIGNSCDFAFLMTYEWGYAYGPPMAVSPIPSVRRVLDYAVTRIPPEKLLLGIPNYGYDWPVPFIKGETVGQSVSNRTATELAVDNNAEIFYDTNSQAPYFFYRKEDALHEVWFEDARSIASKLDLVTEYGFAGALYWNFDRPNSQNLSLLIFNASEPDVPCRPCTDAAPQG